MSYSLPDILARYNAERGSSYTERQFISFVFGYSLECNPDGKCSESFIRGLTLDEINWIMDESEPA